MRAFQGVVDMVDTSAVNDSKSVTLMAMSSDPLGSMVTQKFGAMAVMFIITLSCGMLPLAFISQLRGEYSDVSSRIKWRRIISFCSCFSGGVFLGACFMDLQIDVMEKMTQVMSEIKDLYNVDLSWFPATQFIMLVGFSLMLLIEQWVHHVQERNQEEEREPLLSSVSHDRISYQSTTHHHHHIHDHDHHEVPSQPDHSHDGHHHHSHDLQQFQHTSFRAFVLLLALSFHSVFEGIAIGLQDNSAQLTSISFAVSFHKAVMAFSMGLNIAQSDLSLNSVKAFIIMFSVSSPIGVGVGIAIAGLPPSLSQDLCNVILQGIAGGTFLYITFFEVLLPEFTVPGKRVWKGLCVLTGILSIAVLMVVTNFIPDSDSGDSRQDKQEIMAMAL